MMMMFADRTVVMMMRHDAMNQRQRVRQEAEQYDRSLEHQLSNVDPLHLVCHENETFFNKNQTNSRLHD